MKKYTIIFAFLLLSACGAEEQPQGSSGSSGSSSSSSSGLPSGNSDLLNFISPRANEIFNEGQIFNVEVGAVNADEVASVHLYVNGIFFRAENIVPWDWNPTKGDTLLQSLLPGAHELTAVATTLTGESYATTVEIEIAPADFRVTGLSLVDVPNVQNVANYDPIYMGNQVEINLDDLGISQYSFLADHEGNVGSVVFLVNGAEYRIDSGAPYALTQNTGPAPLPVDFAPGAYQITAIPFAEINGGGAAGPGKTINILIQKSDLQWSQEPVRLVSSIESGQAATAELSIQNLGNIPASATVLASPSWLTVSNTGEVAGGEQRAVTLTSPACNRITENSGVLTLQTSTGITRDINVSWSCSERPAFDFALSRFYFNQVVPQNDSRLGSEGSKVDLIQGRPGLARAFVTRNNTNSSAIPSVDLHYRLASGATGVYSLQKAGGVPMQEDEGRLDNSFNLLIPEGFFQPGTEYYVSVNANGNIPENTFDNNRYPANGYRALDIVSPRLMELVFVPLFVAGNPEFNLTDADVRQLMSTSTVFLPIDEYSFTIREPASYSGSSWTEAIQLINSIRMSEERFKFYHGIVNGPIGSSNTAGIAQVAANSGLSIPDPGTIAHELGHNLSLSHTDCGGPQAPEPGYPHANARTGNWGYDISRSRLVPPDRADFMSYCYPPWVGSFSFQKMVHYFVLNQSPRTFQFYAPSLVDPTIISGSITGGQASIDHVFDAQGDYPTAENVLSPYELKLFDMFGVEIFSTAFEPQTLDHSNALLFDIPVEAGLLANETYQVKIFHNDELLLAEPWQSQNRFALSVNLQQTASTPAPGEVTIEWNPTGEYTLWVRDAQTGRILGMDSTGEITVHTQAQQLELTYAAQSRKIKRVIDVPLR